MHTQAYLALALTPASKRSFDSAKERDERWKEVKQDGEREGKEQEKKGNKERFTYRACVDQSERALILQRKR